MLMMADVIVPVNENTHVAAARRAALEIAGRAGLNETHLGAVGIVVTEAATNIIKHGGGGEIILRELRGGPEAAIEIIASDRGIGMANQARCFEDGYSTAGSPGNGLGAIARLSCFHQVYTGPGVGTVLVAHVGVTEAVTEGCEAGAISVPYPGEEVCGDAWLLQASPGRCRLLVADGLGHGIYASEAAARAVELARQKPAADPVALLEDLHQGMRTTRGAALAVADLLFAERTIVFAGVGNISGSVVHGSERRQMVSMNGTVGHEMRKVQAFKYPMPPDSLVILHSDGLSASWMLDKYPGLMSRHASVIAAVLLRDYRRQRDDATVVVIQVSEPRQ